MKKVMLTALAIITLATQATAWAPKGDKIRTPWAEKITPENAWREYPRPQLKRAEWTNLNGLWQYAVTNMNTQKKQVKFEGEILVPFAIESSLSGVARSLDRKSVV